MGILTGKYSQGIPEGSRLTNAFQMRLAIKHGYQERAAKVDKMVYIATEFGCSMAQLAIAWVASNPHVSTVILGATSTLQLAENLRALEFVDKITPEVRAKIDKQCSSGTIIQENNKQ